MSPRFWWRVTRYDPRHRDERGAYVGETWTSIGDVGREFEGQRLTAHDYAATEDAYVAAVVAFAADSGVESVEVRDLERGAGVRAGDVVSIAASRELVRRMLREEVIGKLEDPDGRFAVHVGFDLYMYIGSHERCERAVGQARAAGLFVDEDFPSPYAEGSAP